MSQGQKGKAICGKKEEGVDLELFGIKTCDTCRKALKDLAAAGHAPTFVDVRATPLDAATLATFIAAFGADLVNRRSTTWRGLEEDARQGEPADLLAAHPTLMKRPVIRTEDGTLHLGWTAAVKDAVL